MTARLLSLVRMEPGPSEETRPTGIVAEATVFSDGTAVLHWLTEPRGTEFYPDETAMRKIREASGRSRFYEDASAAPRIPVTVSTCHHGWPEPAREANAETDGQL